MQPKIKQSNDYSLVATDIVNNMEKYRVDAQEKTERTIKRLLEEKAKAKNQAGNVSPASKPIAEQMGYGINTGRRTGD